MRKKENTLFSDKLENLTNEFQASKHPVDNFWLALMRLSIFVFALFGSLYCFLYCFQIPVEIEWIIGGLSAYILVFLILFSIKQWYWTTLVPICVVLFYAWNIISDLRQGFMHVLNHIMRQFTEHSMWDFPTFVTDSVSEQMQSWQSTLFILFLYFFIAFALGFFIIRRPSVWGVIGCTAPFLCAALYFVITPPLSAFFGLMAAYFMMYVYKSSAQTRLTLLSKAKYKNKQSKIIRAQSTRFSPQHITTLAMLPVLLASLLCASLILPSQEYKRPPAIDNLQQAMEKFDLVRMLSGGYSGLGRGDLRNLGAIRAQGETVLKVKSSMDVPFYLRGYAGAVFTGSQWEEMPDIDYEEASTEFSNLIPQTMLADYLSFFQGNDSLSYEAPLQEISIQNIALGNSTFLIPNGLRTRIEELGKVWFIQDTAAATAGFGGIDDYVLQSYPIARTPGPVYFQGPVDESRDSLDYIYLDTSMINGAFVEENQGWTNERGITFDTFLSEQYAYRRYVYDTYTALPADVKDRADTLRSQYGLAPIFSYDTFGGLYLNVEQICENLRSLLAQQCRYTLAPEIIPEEEDFVTYFLNESKEGYCVHFATAATVLLRSMGIPARYAEGFGISAADFEKSRDEDGYFPIDDSQAHAWVEVYDPYQMEWIPVEMTPGYTEEQGQSIPEEDNLENEDPAVSSEPDAESQSSQSSSSIPETQNANRPGMSANWIFVAYAAGVIVLLVLATILARKIALYNRRQKLTQKDTDAAVLAAYRWIQLMLHIAECDNPENLDTPESYSQKVCQKLPWLHEDQLTMVLRNVQKARFSGVPCTEEERRKVLHFGYQLADELSNHQTSIRRQLSRYFYHVF